MSAQSVPERYQRARAARDAGEFATYLSVMQQLDSLRPQHPVVLYELGIAQSLNQRPKQATQTLARALWLNAGLPIELEPLLANFRDTKAFDSLQQLTQVLKATVAHGAPAGGLPDTTFHPEGVVWYDGRYFVSSVRKGTIITSPETGQMSEFARLPAGFSAMGLAIDSLRKTLWVAGTATEHALGYTDSLAGRAGLWAFDLKTGVLKKKRLINHLRSAWLGDVTVDRNGTAYATSSSADFPAIYRTTPGEDTLSVWQALPDLASLQGLCLSPEEKYLFLSDYRYGLFRITLESGKIVPLKNQTDHPLKGIDGLCYYQGWLVAIHNGLRPFRVVAFQLSPDQTTTTNFITLEKALPEMDEPTLGTVAGNTLHYVANSPWGKYAEDGSLPAKGLYPPLLRRVGLKEFCRPHNPKPKIACLGVFHFAGTSDYSSVSFDRLDSEKRQGEIRDLIEQLKAFKPTKILVEYPAKSAEKLDSSYAAYCRGEYSLSLNEVDQLGFRIARELEHDN
ncbi:MAG: DUF5694 domain-containing protein, partial [Bacteroidota bacterium]